MFEKVFQGRPVGKQRSRGFMVSVGIFAILLACLTFYVGYEADKTVPGRGYYNLHAVFNNAENLANHYEARLGGNRAGQVLDPRVKDGKAYLDLRLDKKYKPLLSDTQLRVRLRSAVGVRYLEIIPGTKGTPLPEGATIPVGNTQRPVALDKVLATFDPVTREKTQTLLNELGAGTLSRGGDVNAALGTAPKFFGALSSVSREIVGRTGAMSHFISAANGAADTFDPVKTDIAEGFRPESAALRPFVDARSDVQKTLDTAAPALATLRANLPAVSALLAQASGLSREGLPTLAEAPASLRATTALLQQGDKPLGDAKKTLELAQKAVDPTLGLLDTTRPVLPSIEQAVNDLKPTVEDVAPRACDISHAMTGWSSAMKYGDSVGNFIRFQLVAARLNELGGSTMTPLLKAPNGADIIKSLNHIDSYTAPCVGDYGAAGPPRPDVAESALGLTYTRAKPPGYLTPGYHGIEESGYQGLKEGGR